MKVSSCGEWRLWQDCADVQASLSRRWTHMSEGTFSHISVHVYCRIFGITNKFNKSMLFKDQKQPSNQPQNCVKKKNKTQQQQLQQTNKRKLDENTVDSRYLEFQCLF